MDYATYSLAFKLLHVFATTYSLLSTLFPSKQVFVPISHLWAFAHAVPFIH